MTPQSVIAKGKVLENFIVDRLRVSGLDPRAARNPGSGNGVAKADIWNSLNLAIECKNQKNFSQDWLKQSERQATGGQPWCVIWHRPKTPLEDSVVILPLWHYEELLKRNKEPVMKEMDKTVKWKVESLKRAANELLKEL